MKHKILSLLLAIIASIGMLFAEVKKVQIGDLYYNLDGTNAEVTYRYAQFNYSTNSYYYYGNCMAAVEIPSSVTYQDVTYNVTSIGANAFRNCTSLTSITIPNSVTSIGVYAFSGCSSLTSITIGESVTSIGYPNFEGCTKLASVVWNAKKCNDFSSRNTLFYYYYNNKVYVDLCEQITSFTFGDNVEYIPAYLCKGMTNLTSITIPNSVTTIGYDAFSSCGGLTSVAIGNNVETIGQQAFYGCSNITSDINLNSVKTIGQQAFYNCSGLTKVVIGDNATSIGLEAFRGCTYLEEITIGSGINVDDGIEANVFYGCRYLLSVTCKAVYPPVINANVFDGCGVLGGVDLYVPEESVKRYNKASVWSEFNIVGKDFPNEDDPSNPDNPEDGKCTITWQDEDGNVIKTDEVEQGTMPAYTGTMPTKEGYEFAGWLPKIQPATKDICYTTFFERNKIETPVYTVNINGENCSLNINNQYPEGTVITLEAVADECFEFRQWSDGNKDNPRTITVTANTNLTAEFNKVRYTVTGQPSTGGKVQIRKQ